MLHIQILKVGVVRLILAEHVAVIKRRREGCQEVLTMICIFVSDYKVGVKWLVIWDVSTKMAAMRTRQQFDHGGRFAMPPHAQHDAIIEDRLRSDLRHSTDLIHLLALDLCQT